jgi:hypothetical protein
MEPSRILEKASIVLFLGLAGGVLAYAGAARPAPTALADPAIAAYAYAMPGQGWAPLTVYFSAYESHGPGGRLTRYEWDLDGDGAFETDASASGGYTSHTFIWAGRYTVTLRVSDEQGRFATAGTVVQVRHPASSQVDYWSLFDDSRVDRIDLIVSGANWDRLWADPASKTEVEADAVIFGERVRRIGLRMKGNASLAASGEKKSWVLDFNAFDERQKFHNLSALLLHNNFGDPSLLREKLGYDLMAFAGVPGGFTAFVEVWVDVAGDAAPARYLGIYLLVERPDRAYLANRFGRRNDGGNLYKADAFFEQGAADLAYYGDTIERYPRPRGRIAYRKMTNEEEADYADIINLTTVIDGVDYATPEEFAAALEPVFNVDGFLRYMAVTWVTLNLDSYPYTGNNYYLYHDPGSGRFEWLAWDLNSSWGLFAGDAEFPLYGQAESLGPLQRAPLFERVFEVERYRRTYRAYVDLLLRERLNGDAIAAETAAWQALLEPYLGRDAGDRAYFGDGALYPFEEFARDRERLVELTRARHDFLRAALAAEAPGPEP